MKNLIPINSTGVKSTLIASDIAEELRSEINTLKSANTALQKNISDLESKIDSSTVSKSLGSFAKVEADNGSFSGNISANSADINGTLEANNLVSSSTTTSRLSADTINTTHISSDDGSFNSLDADTATIQDLNVNRFTADDFTVDRVVTDKVNANEANLLEATINELNVTRLNTPQELNANKVTSPEMTAEDFESTGKAVFKEAEAVVANIERLKTQNIIYNDNENDATQYIRLDPESSSDTANDYKFIEIPSVESGYYRIDVKKDDNEYFAVTCINTETGPIVHYSRVLEGDVEKIYYDTLTRKWYIKTYAAGRIYWSNNDKNGNLAPQTFAELPIDEEAVTTLRYDCKGKTRLVIMGDNTLDYGLTVQGVLEANMIKESTAYHQLFFYGNEWSALKKFADKYLTYEDKEGVKHYTNSETAGYLFHTDDNYRDEDDTETEALEKISYDGTKVTFTVDANYGQDEIEIDSEENISWTDFTKIPKSGLTATSFMRPNNPSDNAVVNITGVSYDLPSDATEYTVQELIDNGWLELYRRIESSNPYTIYRVAEGVNIIVQSGDYAIPLFSCSIWDDGNTLYNGPVNGVEINSRGAIANSYRLDNGERINYTKGITEDTATTKFYKVDEMPYFTYNAETWLFDTVDINVNGVPYLIDENGKIIKGITVNATEYELSGTPSKIVKSEMDNVLPFIISFTLSAYNWDLNMNDEMFNSWGVER